MDIDLFTGALTEEPEKDGEVGPTLACLLGEQFMRLKYGDRFWFQNTEGVENSFTQGIGNQCIYTPQKNLRTSTYVFSLFNTESLIFKMENIF